MPFNLRIDDEFFYYGVPYIVHSIDPPYISIQRVDGDKKIRTMELVTIFSDRNFSLGEDMKKRAQKENIKRETKIISLFDKLPAETKEIVVKRFEIIKPILLFEKAKLGDYISSVLFNENYSDLIPENTSLLDFSKNKLIEKVAKKHGRISGRTIKRYLASYKQYEIESPTNGKDGLISKKVLGQIVRNDEFLLEIAHPKKKDLILDTISLRIDKAYAPIIKEAIERHYLNKRKPNITNIKDLIEVMCFKENLEPLGYDTVYQIVKRINTKVVNVLRNGDKALEDYELNERGFYKNAKVPLHMIEIDHTLLDMDVIDENSAFNIGRPWITMGIDVFSREIWCLHISFDAPSANKVRKAIEHGLFFKDIKKKYNTLSEWEICGIPQIIYVDNGPDFKSSDVQRMINEGLNIQVMYRPVKQPKYGAVIERAIGTINKSFIHNLNGNRKSNTKDLGEYDAEKEAIFTLEDIKELITRYIVDVYHHNVHASLPLEYPTPAAMFYHGIDIFGYPDFIPKDEEGFYKIKLLAQDKRKYTKDGIRKDNVIYYSSETSKFITSPMTSYNIKYDIDDISYIYIQDPETGEYIKVYSQNPPSDDVKGMNRKTYKLIVNELRKRGKINLQQIPGSRDITLGKKLLQDIYNQMIKRNKKARQNALKAGLTLTTTSVDINKPTEGIRNDLSDDLLSLAEMVSFERKQRNEDNAK